jgi:hypothetical protein
MTDFEYSASSPESTEALMAEVSALKERLSNMAAELQQEKARNQELSTKLAESQASRLQRKFGHPFQAARAFPL